MTTDRDVADHHAAGALADELPYWGWLPDDRTCLTRRGGCFRHQVLVKRA